MIIFWPQPSQSAAPIVAADERPKTAVVVFMDKPEIVVVVDDFRDDSFMVDVTNSPIIVNMEDSGMARTDGKIVIDAGEFFSKIFKFRLNAGVDPVDFSDPDFEWIKFAFPNSDGTWTVLSSEDEEPTVGFELSGDDALGNVLVEIPEETTALLKRGEGQNIEVAWSIDGEQTTVLLERVLEVRKPKAI